MSKHDLSDEERDDRTTINHVSFSGDMKYPTIGSFTRYDIPGLEGKRQSFSSRIGSCHSMKEDIDKYGHPDSMFFIKIPFAKDRSTTATIPAVYQLADSELGAGNGNNCVHYVKRELMSVTECDETRKLIWNMPPTVEGFALRIKEKFSY
ncbi:hypothetical protein [Microbulbifer sp. SSSA008]|uniref:hypothetical protein n=1 Tax=unclassified Microbulbifer TaxID=2619833 RepID=UPI0040395C82